MAVASPFGVLYDGTLTIARYPASAVGTTLTASGMTTGAYAYLAGNEAQIMAAATIATVFWLVAIAPGTPSVRSIFTIDIGSGAAGTMTSIAEFHWDTTEVTAVGVMQMGQINCPIPMYCLANGAIIGNAASNNVGADDTCICAVLLLA